MTLQRYTRICEAFEQAPGNFSWVVNRTGSDTITVRRAWLKGWPDKGFKPCSEHVQEQQEAARALAQQRREDARDADKDAAEKIASVARLDVAKEREKEGQVARLARNNALALLATAAQLAKTGFEVAKNLTPEDILGMPVRERVRALKVIAEFNSETVKLAEKAVALERTIMGEPEVILHSHRHEHTVVQENPEDVGAMVERASKAVQRAKDRMAIDVKALAPSNKGVDEE